MNYNYFKGKINAKTFTVAISIAVFLFAIIPIQSALAVPIITWDFSPHDFGDGAVGSPPIIVTVNDVDANTTAIDTITISITSNADPIGIPLTLTETGSNTAIFTNTNLIFHTGGGLIPIGRTVTVTIDDIFANFSSTDIDTLPVLAQSSSDLGGLPLLFTETGENTGRFTGKIRFDTVPSGSFGNTLNVVGGDEITIMDTLSGLSTNGLILPNPDAGFGAIKVDPAGDIVNATYAGVTEPLSVPTFDLGGGSGGGLITHPGLVLDLIAFSGSTRGDFSPPTFTLNKLTLDSLLLPESTLNSIKEADPFKPLEPIGNSSSDLPFRIGNGSYPLFGYSQTIETYTVQTDTLVPVELVLQDPSGIEHVGLYTNIRGAGGEIQDSDTYIIYDKGKSIEVTDPHGFFSGVNVTTSKEGYKYNFLYDLKFARHMDTSDMIFRIWDEKRNSGDTKIFDAIKVIGEPVVEPGVGNLANTETVNILIPYYKFPHYTIPVADFDGNIMYYNSFGGVEQKQVHPYRPPTIYPDNIGRAERHDDGFEEAMIKEDIKAQTLAQALIGDPFKALKDRPEHKAFFYPSTIGRLDRKNIDTLNDLMMKEHVKATKICSELYHTNHTED